MRKPRKRTAAKAKRIEPKDSERDVYETPQPPKGKSYQWIAIAILGQPDSWSERAIKSGGWRPVPFSRHASTLTTEYRAKPNKIVHSGLMLFERSAKDTAAALSLEQRQAVEMFNEAAEPFGLQLQPSGEIKRIEPFGHILAGFKVESEPYDPVAPNVEPLVVEVRVRLVLSARLQDAAAACRIDPPEYAQRLATLYARDEIPGFLVPSGKGADTLEIQQFRLERVRGQE